MNESLRVLVLKGVQRAGEAVQLDREACQTNDVRTYRAAVQAYVETVDLYMAARKAETREHLRETLRVRVEEYLERGEVLKAWLDEYRRVNQSDGDKEEEAGPDSAEGAAKQAEPPPTKADESKVLHDLV